MRFKESRVRWEPVIRSGEDGPGVSFREMRVAKDVAGVNGFMYKASLSLIRRGEVGWYRGIKLAPNGVGFFYLP